jgi:hypothetical protein
MRGVAAVRPMVLGVPLAGDAVARSAMGSGSGIMASETSDENIAAVHS